MGKFEIEDQMDGSQWLAKMPFVDAKILATGAGAGGGFCDWLIQSGADVFSAAVAG